MADVSAVSADKKPARFPSHFVPKNVKQSREWNKQMTEAFHNEAAFTPGQNSLLRYNSRHTTHRKYGRGEQSQLQYKELMGLKKDKGQYNTSFRNLNFENLKIVPKLRQVLINKVLNFPYRMQVKPIDQASINERSNQKAALLEYVVSQEQIAQFEQLTQMGLEKPVAPGELPPTSSREVEPWLDMHPKNAMAMEIKDYLTWSLAMNDWKELSREMVGDLVDIGIGGTIQYVDANGFVRFDRILAERSICNPCIYPDFRDLIRFGYYKEITVSELKRLTKGEWGEDTYRKIANTVAEGGQDKYTDSVNAYYNSSTFTYAYDHEKITVLNAMYYSTDTATSMEFKNGSGNRRVKEMEFNYVPYKGEMSINNGKGMSDVEYNKLNEGKKKLYRAQTKNVYKCSWIVGTEYVFNYGLLENMLRSVNILGETQMPVAIYSTDFISPISLIEQPADQVQLNWLQFQSHSAASKPPGLAIEKKALARVAVGGKSGKKWDPKEDLIMYAEIGSLVYDGYDGHGNPLTMLPFKELKNGLSTGAMDHLALIFQMIDLMRDILGLNVLTEGQTPPERLGKQVAQMAWGASDNALSHLNDAYRKIYEKTCKNAVQLLMAYLSSANEEGFKEALGAESWKYFNFNSELGLREMGILIEEGPDDEVKARISELVQKAVDNKEIDPEDGIYIELEDNYYRAIQMLKKSRLERERRLAGYEQQKITTAADAQTKQAMALQEAKAEADQTIQDREESMKMLESRLRQQEEDKKFLQTVILNKLEREKDLEDADNDFIREVMKIVLKGDMDIKKAKATPKPKQLASK